MARTSPNGRRQRGHIRKRGGSFQVLVYAGVDPLTGKDHYLTESTRDDTEAQKILTRLLAAVDERRNPRTKATLGAAVELWLRTLEAEETTALAAVRADLHAMPIEPPPPQFVRRWTDAIAAEQSRSAGHDGP